LENISWLLDIKNKYLQQYVLESGNGQIAYLFGDEADEDSADYFKYYVMEVTESPKLEESIYTYICIILKVFLIILNCLII